MAVAKTEELLTRPRKTALGPTSWAICKAWKRTNISCSSTDKADEEVCNDRSKWGGSRFSWLPTTRPWKPDAKLLTRATVLLAFFHFGFSPTAFCRHCMSVPASKSHERAWEEPSKSIVAWHVVWAVTAERSDVERRSDQSAKQRNSPSDMIKFYSFMNMYIKILARRPDEKDHFIPAFLAWPSLNGIELILSIVLIIWEPNWIWQDWKCLLWPKIPRQRSEIQKKSWAWLELSFEIVCILLLW